MDRASLFMLTFENRAEAIKWDPEIYILEYCFEEFCVACHFFFFFNRTSDYGNDKMPQHQIKLKISWDCRDWIGENDAC